MTTDSEPLERSRRNAAFYLTIAAVVCVPIISVLGMVLPVSSFWPGVLSAICAVIAVLGYRMHARQGLQLLAIGLAAQPMALVYALAQTGWQIDGHFFFLVALAALVSLSDVRAIVAATALIVVHHLGLSFFLPQFVFPSVDPFENVARALFHGAAVVFLDIGLIYAVVNRQRMDWKNSESVARAEEHAKAIEVAQQTAETHRETAVVEAEKARLAQVEAEAALAEARKIQDEKDITDTALKEADRIAQEQMQNAQETTKDVVDLLQVGLAKLAVGDISHRIVEEVPQHYEMLRRDYNRAMDQLATTLNQVTVRSKDLKDEVEGISQSATQLAERTEQQVASMEQTANEIDTLNNAIRQSADQARQTAQTAHTMRERATSGSNIVQRTITAMSDIEASAEEIAKINSLIDGIAFQTNLLALNAGVEAARAGEAGRGFSVVASEVRALAQRATEAANEIGRLVSSSQAQVGMGVSLVAEAGDTLNEMMGDISSVSDSVDQIADVSQKQSDGFERVTKAIRNIDALAQQNAAMFEETSAACEALNKGMDMMKSEVSEFKLPQNVAERASALILKPDAA